MSDRRMYVPIAAFGVILAGVIALLVIPLPLSWRSGWFSKLLDLGHIPLFAMLTLMMHRLLRVRLSVACGFAITAAGAGELLQTMVQRSADFGDFVRGAIGSLVAALLVRACRTPRSLRNLVVSATLSIALLTWPVAEALPKLWDATVAYRAFPTIGDFTTRWSEQRWSTDQLVIERVTAERWPGEWIGRMDFFPSAQHSAAAVLFPVRRDWSSYRQL